MTLTILAPESCKNGAMICSNTKARGTPTSMK
jgi:hypothetical protein